MKRLLLFFFVFLLNFRAIAQDSCVSDEKIEDLHAVSKCSIKTSQKKIKGNNRVKANFSTDFCSKKEVS